MSARLRVTIAAMVVIALAACSGSSFGTGTAAPGGVNPPVNPSQAVQGAQPSVSPASTSAAPSPAAPQSHSFADAGTTGIPCPESNGFSCTLYFNQPAPTPTPNGTSKLKRTATPSPTPSPSPTPQGSGSPSPTPSPTPSGAQMNVVLQALPKDAPKMVNPDPKAVSTVALVALSLSTTADVAIEGRSTAEFTLPKEQIGSRGFAIQFYHQTTRHKHVDNQFAGSYNVSHIKENRLSFSYTIPKITVKKGESWLIVLYGDELPRASASPPSAAASSSASPAAASPAAASSAEPTDIP